MFWLHLMLLSYSIYAHFRIMRINVNWKNKRYIEIRNITSLLTIMLMYGSSLLLFFETIDFSFLLLSLFFFFFIIFIPQFWNGTEAKNKATSTKIEITRTMECHTNCLNIHIFEEQNRGTNINILYTECTEYAEPEKKIES